MFPRQYDEVEGKISSGDSESEEIPFNHHHHYINESCVGTTISMKTNNRVVHIVQCTQHIIIITYITYNSHYSMALTQYQPKYKSTQCVRHSCIKMCEDNRPNSHKNELQRAERIIYSTNSIAIYTLYTSINSTAYRRIQHICVYNYINCHSESKQ